MTNQDSAPGHQNRRPEPTVIKKYANRRLYNTATSSYVTLENLSQMVKAGEEFTVHDAKTGEDITHTILTQIIVEEESKGQVMLPVNFLRQLIGFYGDSLQSLLPGYLETALQSFARNQEEMRGQMEKAFGGMFPFKPFEFKTFEDMARQNLALMQQAAGLFNPFAAQNMGQSMGQKSDADAGKDADEVARLRAQLVALQQKLDALSKK